MANYQFAQLAVPPGDDTKVGFAQRARSDTQTIYINCGPWLAAKGVSLVGVSWSAVGPALVVSSLSLEGSTVAFLITSGTAGATDPLRITLRLSDSTTKAVTIIAPVAAGTAQAAVPIIPGQVGSLTAGTPTDTLVPVSYTPPATGTQTITYAGATRTPPGSGLFASNAGSFGASGGTFVGLVASTSYDLRITATNAAGSSSTFTASPVTTAVAGTGGGTGVASNVKPPMNAGTGAVGISTDYMRADAKAPTDTSRYDATNPLLFQTDVQVAATVLAVTGVPPVTLNTLAKIATRVQADEALAAANTGRPYVIAPFQGGKADNAGVLLDHRLPAALTLPALLAGSSADARQVFTGQADYVLAFVRAGTTTPIVTFRFAAAAKTATLVGATTPALLANDILVLTGPAVADATGADVGFVISAVRT